MRSWTSVIPDDQVGVRVGDPPSPAAAVPVRRRRDAGCAGKELFYSREMGCARCHGVYDGRGNVEWPAVHKDVGTDRVAPRCRLGQVHRRVPAEPARVGRRARQESRICRDAADRRVGELSVPPQRERADAVSSARPGVRTPGDLPRDGGWPVRSHTGRPGALRRSGPRPPRRGSSPATVRQ